MTDIPIVNKEDVREDIVEKESVTEKIPIWKKQGFNSRLEWANYRAQLEGFKDEAEKWKVTRWEQGKKIPLKVSNTPASIGKEMEDYVSQIFGELEIMPYGNKGFDFRCKRNGLRIELKRREISTDRNDWKYTSIRDKTADIFMFVALINGEAVKVWMIKRDDKMQDGLPLCNGDRDYLNIGNKPSSFEFYRSFELPAKLKDLQKLYVENNIPLKVQDIKKYTIELCKQSRLVVETEKVKTIDDISSGNKEIKYRTTNLEIKLMQKYLSEHFEDIKVSNRWGTYHLTGIKKDKNDKGNDIKKEVKICHIGRCLGFAKNCDYSRWPIGIEYNKEADYFVISLWKDREGIVPMKILLIHKDEMIRGIPFWKRSGITISNTTKKLREFEMYNILKIKDTVIENK